MSKILYPCFASLVFAFFSNHAYSQQSITVADLGIAKVSVSSQPDSLLRLSTTSPEIFGGTFAYSIGTSGNSNSFFASLTEKEKEKLRGVPGGTELVTLIETLEKAGSPKLPNAVAEAKAALDAINRGLTNIRVNVKVWTHKDGKPTKNQTEVDVLSDEEWTEVKDGDYSTEKKIKGGSDMTQFNKVRNFFKGNAGAELYDSTGKKITKPKKWRYVFTNANGITQKLKDWLTGRDVDEVTADKIIKPTPLPTEKKKMRRTSNLGYRNFNCQFLVPYQRGNNGIQQQSLPLANSTSQRFNNC